jgi:hypothetical protein
MAFRTNFGARRADRNRVQRARNEEKNKQKQDRADQRKAERDQARATTATDEKAPQ